MATYGYARVSTIDQNLDMQMDALNAAGCEKVFIDKASGLNPDRPGWEEAESTLKDGDSLVVWKLDRLGRSMGWLSDTMEHFKKNNINFRSLKEQIDTATAMGRLFFNIIGSLAEFESELIGERTKEGMKAARRRGKRLGRPGKVSREQLDMAANLIAENQSWNIAAITTGVAESTLRRHLINKEVAKIRANLKNKI